MEPTMQKREKMESKKNKLAINYLQKERKKNREPKMKH